MFDLHSQPLPFWWWCPCCGSVGPLTPTGAPPPPAGSTALLLLLCLQHSFPEPSTLYLDLILATLALELLCSLTCLLVYTVKIRKFNKAKPQPDVLEEEKIYAYPINMTSETGFRTLSSLEEIVEKQGDIILYLKRHNALLSRRLLALTTSDLSSQPSGI